MITNLLLDIVKLLCQFIVSVLPPWSLTLPDSFVTACQWLMNFNNILPVYELLSLTAISANLVAVVSAVKWTKQVVEYILDVIP